MVQSKVVKGQAWINGDSLVQEQCLLIPGIETTVDTVVIIEDIWEDLTSVDGTYKTNDKGYFYWEYKMTDSLDDSVEVTVRIECPSPKEGLFEPPYILDGVESKYSKYWLNKYKTATENYERRAAIQKKEITFPKTSYVNQRGELVNVDSMSITNNDTGDISNLLNNLF